MVNGLNVKITFPFGSLFCLTITKWHSRLLMFILNLQIHLDLTFYVARCIWPDWTWTVYSREIKRAGKERRGYNNNGRIYNQFILRFPGLFFLVSDAESVCAWGWEQGQLVKPLIASLMTTSAKGLSNYRPTLFCNFALLLLLKSITLLYSR